MKQLFVIAFSAVAVYATAQSFNIDIGDTAPSSTYGAAGMAGYWNQHWVNYNTSSMSLRNLTGGSLTSVELSWNLGGYSFGGDGNYTGEDRNLMADWVSGNKTWSFSNLLNGTYQVLLYASTYSWPTGSSPSTTFIIDGVSKTTTGGAWPNGHVEGSSYVRYSDILVTDGTLSIQSLAALSGTNGITGIQLEYTSASPVPEPVSMTLMGLGAIAAWRKRRAKQA